MCQCTYSLGHRRAEKRVLEAIGQIGQCAKSGKDDACARHSCSRDYARINADYPFVFTL
jgi:hypothetical protein